MSWILKRILRWYLKNLQGIIWEKEPLRRPALLMKLCNPGHFLRHDRSRPRKQIKTWFPPTRKRTNNAIHHLPFPALISPTWVLCFLSPNFPCKPLPTTCNSAKNLCFSTRTFCILKTTIFWLGIEWSVLSLLLRHREIASSVTVSRFAFVFQPSVLF